MAKRRGRNNEKALIEVPSVSGKHDLGHYTRLFPEDIGIRTIV